MDTGKAAPQGRGGRTRNTKHDTKKEITFQGVFKSFDLLDVLNWNYKTEQIQFLELSLYH